jgi:predicted O-methyltransferase YrrM
MLLAKGSLDMNVTFQLKRMARSALVPMIYRYPPFALAPERLYLFLHHLIETRDIAGSVVEIGCNLGGTAIIAKRMLQGLGISKPYICIDTFDGFIDEQFATDAALGTPANVHYLFSGNSKRLVTKILRRHGCVDVELRQGDIATLPADALPDGCSVVLVDVDLTEPTYVALKRIWPRMSPGGVMLIDDCAESGGWKARIGYVRFCRELGLPESYRFDMGLVTKPALQEATA